MLLGVCVLTLVLVEVVGRIAYRVVDTVSFAVRHRRPPEPTPCNRVMSELTLRWDPYTYWHGKPTHGELVTVEADGRRRTWASARVDSAAPLVAVTGGSAVWGMCVRDDETIPSCVAKALDGANVPARVENHAQIGWVTTQEWIDLERDLRDGCVPRVVVFYDGWNDIVAPVSSGAPGLPLNEDHRALEFNLLSHPARMMLYSLGELNESALVRFSRTLRRRLHLSAPADSNASAWVREFGAHPTPARLDSVADRVVRIYEWNVVAMGRLGDLYGFRPLFYFQPVLPGKATPTAFERATLAADPRMADFAVRVRRRVARSEVLRATPGFHDLSGAFDDDEQEIFFDWCHVTAGANARVADGIAGDVRQLLAVSEAKPGARPRGPSPTTRR